MPIIFNTSELFRYQGSGIKSFTQALIHATKDWTPIELLLEARRKEHDSALAHTNLFGVHPSGAGKAEVFKREVKQSLSQYVPRKSSYRAPKAKILDPLHALALAKVARETGDESLQHNLSFRTSHHVFSNSHLEFVRAGQCSQVEFPDLARGEATASVFHNPLPFPLVSDVVPMVVTIHDVIPLTHSDLCLDDPGRFFDLISLLTDKAAAVHAISHATGDLLINILGDRVRSKLKVIHQALVMKPCSEEQQENLVKSKLDLFDRFHHNADGHSLLQLGTLEPKKNHVTALEVHRILRRKFPGLKMLIIGKAGWLCEDLLDTLPSRREEGVEWLRSAPRSSVRWHLNNSLAMLFPSLVEGWGLPPLEAMALGTPAVCSSIPACQEACGDGAAGMADPHDVTGFCEHLTELLTDRERYAAAIRAGLRRARLYSEARFREELRDLYGSVLEGGN